MIPHARTGAPARSSAPADGSSRGDCWGRGGHRAGPEAVASIDLDPPVTYDIVGQTHPNVLARYGQSYRRSLEKLVEKLGLEDQVRFIDRYVSDEELEEMVAAADLVVIPYDNSEQVSSGC